MKKRILQLCVVAVLGLSGSVNMNAQTTIAYDFTAPASQAAGTDFESSFTYGGLAADAFYQVSIVAASDPSLFQGGATNEFGPTVTGMVTAGSGTINFSVPIPNDFTTSADLTAPNDTYYVFGKITTDLTDFSGMSDLANWAIMDAYPVIEITSAPLSVSNFNANGETVVYVKNSSKTLEVVKSLDENLKIIDLSGRVVMNVDASERKSVSLAELRTGIYVIANKDLSKVLKFGI